MVLLATPVAAQCPRLIDRVEAPIAYVSLDGAATADVDATAEAGTVPQLLADPALAAWLGGADAETARAWNFVRGVLVRDHGEFELALTGVVPGVGQPLLLLRVQLQPPEAQRLQGLLADGALATAHRTLGATSTFRLRGADGAGARPGELVELALVGNDLVVGNDDLGMSELLAPSTPQTTAGAGRHVLASDPQFTALRQRLGTTPGSLFVYGDWPRLGHRLQRSLAGMPGALLEWSGLGSAHSMLLSLAPAKSGYAATLLVSFADGVPGAGGTSAAAAVDGWLAAAQQVPAKQLAAELPGAGLGGVVVAVDLADLASRSHRGEHMLHDLRHSFAEYGLDFDRHVLGRLGALGTVQLLLHDEPPAAAAVAAVYAVRARNRKAASDLFTDLRRAAEARGIGRLIAGKERRAPDVLELRPEHEPDVADAAPICVAVVEDSVLVAFDPETILRVHDDYRRTAKARGRRDAVVSSAVQRIGGDDVCGLFDVDLQGLFAGVAASTAAAGTPLDLSSVPTRHIGYLSLLPQADGALLRVCVLSSQ